MGTSRRQEEIEERNKRLAEVKRRQEAEKLAEGQYHITCNYLYQEAMKLNLWLYDPKFKCWHEPEVFYRKYHTVPKSDPVFTRVQLKDPMDGLKAGHEMLENLSNRLLIFAERIKKHYASKPNPLE